jgi:dihydroorotate dehydrogenase
LVRRVRNHRFKGILGINIGKNFDTPLQHAAGDYVHCLEKVYPYADYVTINVSSPNTSQLRELQAERALDPLLDHIARAREKLSQQHGRRLPIALKVAPDLETAAIADIARMVAKHRMDAVIATNTTISRNGVEGLEHAEQTGGLSGLPLKPLANRMLAAFRQQLDADIALIGVGGICCGGDAVEKMELGADLVQMYTGLVYHGPALIRDCLAAIARQAPA